jgi:CheY-like chemotaxis protein
VTRNGFDIRNGERMTTGATSTILVVDDDPLIRGAAKAILEQQGHTVRTAPDGEAGLAAVAAAPADIVFLDILMPRKEGLETLIELKRRFPQITVIVMSGSMMRNRNDFLSIATKFGADAVLRKPFTPGEMLGAMQTATAGRNAVRAAPPGHG